MDYARQHAERRTTEIEYPTLGSTASVECREPNQTMRVSSVRPCCVLGGRSTVRRVYLFSVVCVNLCQIVRALQPAYHDLMFSSAADGD